MPSQITNPFILKNIDKIVSICKNNDVSFLGLFGSYSRNEETKESDIDMVVEFQGSKSLLDRVHVRNELSDSLHKPVDLLLKKNIKSQLKEYILCDLQELFSN